MSSLAMLAIHGIAFTFGFGNVLIEKSLSEQLQISDVVLVAKVQYASKCGEVHARCLNFLIKTTFKAKDNSLGRELFVILNSEIDENGLEECCKYEQDYLLFLQLRPDGYYEPVNGKYSVREIRGLR